MTDKQKSTLKKLNKIWIHVNIANEVELIVFIALVILGLLSTLVFGSTFSWISIIFFLLFVFQAKVPFKYSNQQNKKLAYFMDKVNGNDISKYPRQFRTFKFNENSIQSYYAVHWFNWI